MRKLAKSKFAANVGGSGASPPRRSNAVKVPFRSSGERLAKTGDHATRVTPCEGNGRRRHSGIPFRANARRIGREVGLGNPLSEAHILGGKCRVAYTQWLATTGAEDKHRAANIEVATQCALAAQKELKENESLAAPTRKQLRFREVKGDRSYKRRYSFLDEICLPHLRHIPLKQLHSCEWEFRKVVVWDHNGTLKPADLITRAESSDIDLSAWLKVRKVNGSASDGRANRLEILCVSREARWDVMETVQYLLEGVIESECIRPGRSYGFRKRLRARQDPEGMNAEDSNIYEVLRSIPTDEGSAQTLCSKPHKVTTHSEGALPPSRGKTSKKSSGLKVWTLNCQGVTSKAVELSDLVVTHKPDVLVLTETWLKPGATLSLSGYKGLHVNRQTQCARGEGGVAIYTKTSLVARECETSAQTDIAWTKLHLRGRKPLLVGGFYGPQESAPVGKAKECFGTLSSELAMHKGCDVVLLGDFNAKIGNSHPRVGKFCPASEPSRNGKLLLDVLTDHKLTVLNGQSGEGKHTTRHAEGAEPTLLDLIIASEGITCPLGARVLNDLDVGSDHLIVEATLVCPLQGPTRKTTVRKRWNRERLLQMVEEARKATVGEDEDPPPTEYAQACSRILTGWIEKAQNSLSEISAGAEQSADCIEKLWSEWHVSVGEAARESIGEKVISGRRSRSFIDDGLRVQIQERRKLFEEATQSSSHDAWKSYAEKKREIARSMFLKKRDAWDRFNAEILHERSKNPKRYWNLLKRLDKAKSRFTAVELNRPDGSPCASNEEVLEEFTQHFSTVGLNSPGAVFDRNWQAQVEASIGHSVSVDDSGASDKDQSLVAPILAQEVADAAKDLANGRACGRDGIFSELLKHGGEHMMESLALLFDICRKCEVTPKDWHLVNIVALYKKGDKYTRSNYRGITLLSCVYKLYARVLQRRLVTFLNSRIVEEQAGFSAGKGCDDNLCIMTEVMERKVANREALYVALVDMRAAFDTVWRDGLWHKLQAMGVPHKLIRILREIYSHGKFRVAANGETGPDVEAATAGVLQGDVLSPDLFKAFINDLPQFLANAGCTGVDVSDMRKVTLLLFADDILLWGDTQAELQLQLDALRDYCRLWQLEVSAPKTKVLLSPYAKLQSPLLYDGKALEVVDDSAYLGVLFSGKVDFSAMIEKTVKKALGRQSALATLLTDRQLPMLLRYTVWTTMVRPILEWGLEVYTPPKIDLFEGVQRAALRMIAGAQVHTPIVVLEGDLGASTIQERMDLRKCSLIGKLKMASNESLLGQVRDQPKGKCTRGKKTLRGELERLEKKVLRPAGLSTIDRSCEEDGGDPLEKWKASVRDQYWSLESARRATQLEKLSSLTHLRQNGTDYSIACAHPYTTSTDGGASSLWFKIRSNTLPLGRLLAKNKVGVSDKCKCCGGVKREDLMHFLCGCPALDQDRSAWIDAMNGHHAEHTISLTDIPKLVLGPASALSMLPQKTACERVAVVEKLLKAMWRSRNALHHGAEPATRPRRPESHCQKTATPRSNAKRGKLDIRAKPPRPPAPRVGRPCQRGAMQATVSKSNADHSSEPVSGPLTRNKARLLRQQVVTQVEPPSRPEPPQAKAKKPTHPPAPCVQTNRRSRRLESMELISKT